MNKKRIDWVDITRGWAIILVILGHCPIPSKLISYIYSFHVPLFFILSGFLSHNSLNKTFIVFLKEKFFRLVVPYFFFSLITYLYWLILYKIGVNTIAINTSITINPLTPLNGTLMAIRDPVLMVHNATLWFICSLFLSEIIFYFIYKIAKGDRLIIGMML